MQEELKSETGAEAEEGAAADDVCRSEGNEDAGQVNGTAELAENDAVADGEGEVEDDELTPEKFDELNDRYLRALAEVQNVRRIAERDRLEAGRYGASKLARDLLPVHDSLKRALDSVDELQKEHSRALIEGIELTLKELLNAIGRHGVKVVSPAKGDEFDPKLHQAMFEAPSTDIESGRIMEVMAEGFTIHDRLLRPAQVGVSSGSPSLDVQVEQESQVG